MVGVLVAHLPGNLIQAFRGRRERELRFRNAPLNHVVDGRDPVFLRKLMRDVAYARAEFLRERLERDLFLVVFVEIHEHFADQEVP